ncbi:hypothetical protein D9611_002996 [Ephemerocybe angulata]|uniref:F-box domain-containing protein n=1 Tax=Ephemerocybe angulata TaxID=980116 RepID=A0A8H5FHR5_9AGAR|nr:hypothetical protein D9611_002996 [Tulosesus angulatus]
MKETEDKQAIAELLKNNNPPSFEQTALILSTVQELEKEFQKVVGKAFSFEVKDDEVPKGARRTLEAIRLRRALLSGIRSIPDEILRQVFEFIVLDGDGDHDATYLRRLCSVSHRWRQAAIGNCLLWTQPDPICIFKVNERRIQRYSQRLKLYLGRSGALPLTFTLIVHASAWKLGTANAAILEIVQALVSHCHRWQEAMFRVPLLFYSEKMSSIRGHVPLLSSLRIDTDYHGDDAPDDGAFKIHCFADAPNLRKVVYDTRYAINNQFDNGLAIVHFDFPWSQLEELTADAQGDNAYANLLESQPLELHTLEYMSHTISDLPTTIPLTLPKLGVLKLNVVDVPGDLLAHLSTLTLPSLKHLEIRGFSTPEVPFDHILALIRRSGCSLERLCLNTSNGSQSSFSKILTLSPDITELYISAPGADILEALILDPSSPAPVLPKLKILSIRNTDVDGVSRILDAAALSSMIKSRTEGFVKDAPHSITQALEEVNFLWDDAEMLHLQISLLETPEAENSLDRVPPALEELASRARTTLTTDFTPWWHPRRRYINLRHHIRMHKFMLELENIDLRKQNSRILVQKSIPYLLGRLRQRGGGRVPGDHIFRFRYRAGKLCKKWKPFLIRDAQPYVWSHIGEGTASIRWILDSSLEADPSLKDEEIWEILTGNETRARDISWY